MEDLVKLAKQFDKNMQDRESSDGLRSNGFSQRGNAGKAQRRSADKMKELQCSSLSDGVEAELQALFDCSTQRVSGRLSQGSSASSCSQDAKDEAAAARLQRSRQTRLSSGESRPAADLDAAALGSNNDFDDDWENDELLNDPLFLEIAHNPPQREDKSKATSQTNTGRETEPSCAGFQAAKTPCVPQASPAHSKLSCSTLQELCPKLRTTNRSTFRLEPNLLFQAKDLPRPALTPLPPKPRISGVTSTTTKTLRQADKPTNSAADAPGCSQVVSDSQWEDGDDDTLLYQVCDSVERISNTQLDQGSSGCRNGGERGQEGTTPAPMEAGASSRAQRESPRTFVRSNSLPATSGEAGSCRGWDRPMRGTNSKAQMSRSLPGRHVALGTFSQSRDRPGKFQTGNDGAFKRNCSDSAVLRNKGVKLQVEMESGTFVLLQVY